MFLSLPDIETRLLNEQKKCQDRMFIGGLEKFIANQALEAQQNNQPAQQRIIEAMAHVLNGYAAAEPPARRAMIDQALAILRASVPAAPAAPTEPPAETPASALPAPVNAVGAEMPEEDEDLTPQKTEAQKQAVRGFGLDAEVQRLQGVGPAIAKKLHRLEIYTLKDLIYHFPRRYDDYSQLKTISQLMFGEEVTLLLTVCEAKTREVRGGLKITNVLLADLTGTIQVTYFNQPWLQQQFKSGRRIVVSGRVDRDLNKITLKNTDWEPLSQELIHTARIVPVYPLTEGITNRWLRRLINSIVEAFADKVPDALPENIRQREKLVDLETALRQVHFPTSFEKMEAARRRLALDEFLLIQLGMFRQRKQWREQPGRALKIDQDRIDHFLRALPFQLTGAQQRAMNDILGDIQKTQPMSRLLQGDVGSGKTVVAAASMLTAVANGAQAALLAPTEILAQQHFKTLARVFEALPNPPRLRLLTGSLKNREKEEIREQIAAGEIDIAVGTHALIQEDIEFQNLGLAVIDEQHRFGVEQRAMIRSKGYHPHILVMSATPIPRTLALTVYGDLDLSVIDELPPGRQTIQTRWLEPRERERAYAFIRNHVKMGEQVFVICPLIEESEKLDTDAAVAEYERLRKDVYPDLRVGLIHGKLKQAEKDTTMTKFHDHELDILVATSVIEVGIDVPNATVMLIEGADRFGLAQLHQFRGRVGRGSQQSYCLLLAEKKENATDERLKVIEATQDGFRLAEEDLKLRGPGEFFGTRQSGLPDLKIAKLSDVKILEEARKIAEEIFVRDPELHAPEHQLLKQRVAEFWKGKGDLS